MPDVEDLLFPPIQTIADNAAIPVKFPNRNGPENADVWIEVVHIPNGVALGGWNDLKANMGIMNVGIHVPPNTGSTDIASIKAAVLAAFVQSTVLRATGIRVEIYTPPVAGGVFEDGQKSVFPIQIRYRSFET